jgi:hypothetical protein
LRAFDARRRLKGGKLMNFRQTGICIFLTAGLSGAAILLPETGQAQDPKVKTAMELLESMAIELGSPKIEGKEAVADKEVPAIYFGSTKMNNNFELVDEVSRSPACKRSARSTVNASRNIRHELGPELRTHRSRVIPSFVDAAALEGCRWPITH